MSIAKEGNASTFTASAALDTVLEAFSYGRTAAKNRFNLKRESKRCLQQYDETFLSMVQSQIDVDLDKADTEKHNCLHLLGMLQIIIIIIIFIIIVIVIIVVVIVILVVIIIIVVVILVVVIIIVIVAVIIVILVAVIIIVIVVVIIVIVILVVIVIIL